MCEGNGATTTMADGLAYGYTSPSWGMLLPLALENVGAMLALDSRPDALRARLVSKHWRACITRCIEDVTMYGNAVLLPTIKPPPPQLPQQQQYDLGDAQSSAQQERRGQLHPQSHEATSSGVLTSPYDGVLVAQQGSKLQQQQQQAQPNLLVRYSMAGSFAHTLTHVRICGKDFNAGWLRPMSLQMPSLTSLSLSATRYRNSPVNLYDITLTSQHLPNPYTAASAVPAGTAAVAAAGAGAANAALDLIAAMPAHVVEAAAEALGYAAGEVAALVSASASAGRPPWPPAPPQLRKLLIHLDGDMPPDVLRQLLLQPLVAIPESGAGQGSASAAPTPAPPRWRRMHDVAGGPPSHAQVLALQELTLLPQPFVQTDAVRASYFDLAPLLDPRLSGVTKLTLCSLQRCRAVSPAGAAGGQQPWPLAMPLQDLQHQQQQVGAKRAGEQLDPVHILAKLTQLKSLTVLDQVELASFGPQCLAQLSGLEQLRLPTLVFCEAASDLNHLAALMRLSSLQLNFGTEWWIDAGDLRVLSRLVGLRKLELAVDYGFESPQFDMFEDDLPDDEVDIEGDSDADDAPFDSEFPSTEPLKGTEPHAAGVTAIGAASGAKVYGVRPHAVLEPPGTAIAGAASLSFIGRELSREWRQNGGPGSALGSRDNDPGRDDDWRLALCGMTQLRALSLRLAHGGGRHLAAALHGATWLAPRRGGCDDEGVTVALYDAPAATLLDVPYWASVAAVAAAATEGRASTQSPAAAASTAAAPVAATGRMDGVAAMQSPGTIATAIGAAAASMRVPQSIPAAPPPIVSLRLVSGRGLTLSYAHVLCIALMTELRDLQLSYEAAHPTAPRARARAPYGSVGTESCSCNPNNPLLALARLSRLLDLDLRIKQPQSKGASTVALSPIDDDVVHACLEGMPELMSLQLRGVGRLGERGLSAIGRHRRLKSLGMRLKVPAAPRPIPARQPEGVYDNLAATGPGPSAAAATPMPCAEDPAALPVDAASHMANRTAALSLASSTDTVGPLLRLGYGSYYAMGSRPAGGSVGFGSVGGGGTPLGMSPPAPGLMAIAGCGGDDNSCGTDPTALATSVQGRPGAPYGSSATSVTAGGLYGTSPIVGSSGDGPTDAALARQRHFRAGVAATPGILAGVPYVIRPHHLPPTLTILSLTNAAFSSEWAEVCDRPVEGPIVPAASSADATASESALDASVAANATGQTEPLDKRSGVRLDERSAAPAASVAAAANEGKAEAACAAEASPLPSPPTPQKRQQHALPRLSYLRLARILPKSCRQGGQARFAEEGASTPSNGPEAASYPPTGPTLDPTRITDWHLVHFVARQPSLTCLTLADKDAGAGAGPAAKLHYRAVAQLGRLSYLGRLNVSLGNRLRWRAQEALFTSLTPGLRSLRLDVSHLYKEAVAESTRLTHLNSLQIFGYAEPAYTLELESALSEVRRHLPGCDVMAVYSPPDNETEVQGSHIFLA